MNHPMTTKLHGSVEMPMHGLGVYQASDGEEVINAVAWALEGGYRLIDTASIYENEEGVAEGLRRSGLPRDEVFVTTKLWNTDQGYEPALRAFDASLERLGLDYVDLYLLHWPKPDLMADSWRALEQLQREGRTRAIGVSNFEPHHLEQLVASADVAPALNQVELHPHLQQQAVRAADDELGTVTQAWSPIKQGRVLDEPTIVEIAERLDVTPVQVILRWQLQEGIATIPKSVKRERIISNGDVFSFELTDSDMEAMRSLDRGDRIGPHPDHIDF